MQLNLLLFFVLIFSSSTLFGQRQKEKIDSLVDEIELLIGDEWFLEETKDGFQVTFCRSCNENYLAEIGVPSDDPFDITPNRFDFFQTELLDSVCYFSSLNPSILPRKWKEAERTAYFTDLYQADDILRFHIRFEKKWKESNIEKVQARNDEIRDSILRTPLFMSNERIFSDYRYWLPREFWKRRITTLDFYFERLPYESTILDQSIFIEHNKPGFFSEPMLVDKNDKNYFDRRENHLEAERQRTLKIIALVLGIHDYRIIQ